MKEKRNSVIAVVFFLILLLVPCLTLVKMLKTGIPIEQYKGALIGRYQMIKLNTGITQKLTNGTYMESNEVLLGKNGYLFYKVKTDGTPLYDYMGINRFDDNELKKLGDNILEVSNLADKEGFKLAFLTVPNKEQVYSEYMPDTIVKISDISRLNQVTDYVMQNIAIDGYINGKYPYVDVTDRFMELKNEYPLYYKTDTHWTEVGSFIAMQEVLDKVYGEKQDVRDVSFAEGDRFDGDLPRISGTQDRFTENNIVLDGMSVNNAQKKGGTLLVIGDSFGDAMLKTAKYYYDEVYWVRIKNYTEDLLKEYNPDFVIVECVERYLPDLVDYNITDM